MTRAWHNVTFHATPLCPPFPRGDKGGSRRFSAPPGTHPSPVLTNTAGLHGDVAGIIGGTLPEIEGIKPNALAAEAVGSD